MTFKIARIETQIVNHPLVESRIIVSPAGRHDTSRYLNVTVYDAEGALGYGEVATTPAWSGETAETAHCIVQDLFAPRLLHGSFDHPREALALMDKASYANVFAKSGIDTAIWDLWARRQGVSAGVLFGDRAPRTSIPIRGVIGSCDIDSTIQLATELWATGIRTLKFKIGVQGVDDAARLAAVRAALGDEPVFTVDANGAFQTLSEAMSAIELLLPYNLALVEQPTPRERRHLMAAVRSRAGVPILADESIFTPNDLLEALDCECCDLVSLYPGKNGGITNTIDMAHMAQRAGKKCTIGSNLETDLGQGAMAILAASLSAFTPEEHACDLLSALYYQSSSVTNPLKIENGSLLVPAGIGMGVEPLNANVQ